MRYSFDIDGKKYSFESESELSDSELSSAMSQLIGKPATLPKPKPSPQYSTSQIDKMLTEAKKQKQTSTPQMMREAGPGFDKDKARNFKAYQKPKPTLEQLQQKETADAQSRGILGQLGETIKSSFNPDVKGSRAREKATALEQLVADKLNILTLVAKSQGAGAGADLAKGVVSGTLTGLPQALTDVGVALGRDDYTALQRVAAGGNAILSFLGAKGGISAAKGVAKGTVPVEKFLEEALKQSFGADGVEKASTWLAKKVGLLKPELSEAKLLKDAKDVIEAVHADKPKFDVTPGETLPPGYEKTGRVDAQGKPVYRVKPQGEPNAVQVKSPDEEVLRNQRPEVGLPGASKENPQPVQVAGEGQAKTQTQEVGRVATPDVPDTPATEPIGPPDVTAPQTPTDVAGFAKVFTDRDPLTGISPQEVLARAKANTEVGMIDPMDVVTRVTSGGRAMTSDEAGATIVALREHKNRLNGLYNQLEGEIDPLRLNDLNKKIDDLEQLIEKYQQAGDLTGNEWHRLGQALQVGLKPDYSMATIQKRLKGAALGTEVSKQDAEKIGGLAKRIRDAETKVNAQADGIVADLINEVPADSAAVRRYKETLRRFLAGEKEAATRGVGRNRQRGALSVYTITDAERKAMAAARKVARDALVNFQYTNQDGTVGVGARDLKDVLEHLRNNGATGSDETLLRLISEPYRKYLLEADVAKLEIDKAMRDVQKAAQFQLKTKVNKALNITGEIFTTFQRAAKSGLDMSAPFVQGRKAIWLNNKAWREAWKPMIEAAKKGDIVAMNQLADIKRDPMYSRAVAAGLELSEPGGRFTSQEEQFAGNFLRMLSSVNNGKGIPGLNYYIRALENSEAAFSVFLNKVRYDTFKKLASAMPNDPEYLKSVADQMNVVYGRGSGELAKRVGGLPAMGNLMYAPRYTVSKWQYATGMRGTMPPIGSPARKAAEANRFKIYTAHAMAGLGMAGMAKLAGWKVDSDPRSTNYGKAISPDGVAVDLFGSEFEAWRLLTQLAYGKVSLTGNFTRPAGKEGEFVGKYLENKLAPVARNVKEALGGRRDDDYELKPMQTRDWLMNYAPMWLDRNSQDDNALWKTSPGLAILQSVGIDSSVKPKPKYGQKKTVPPPIDLLRPNIYMKKPVKIK